MKYLNILLVIFIANTVMVSAVADQTTRGKVLFTEGHSTPSCRTVRHQENESGFKRDFRIKDVDGNDDVQGILLMALATNGDVIIAWTDGVTTGCGSQNSIGWVRVMTD